MSGMIRMSLFLIITLNTSYLFAVDLCKTSFTEEEIVQILNAQDTFILDQSRLDEGRLGREYLSAEEKEAIDKAHLVGAGKIGEDKKNLSGVGNYTMEQLAGKVRILQPHFSKEERRKLIESCVVGLCNLPDKKFGGSGKMNLQDILIALIHALNKDTLKGLSARQVELFQPHMLPDQAEMLTDSQKVKREDDNTIPSGRFRVNGMDVRAVLIALIHSLEMDILDGLSARQVELFQPYMLSEQIEMLTDSQQIKGKDDNTIPSGALRVNGMDVQAVLVAFIRTLKVNGLSSKQMELLQPYML